MLLPCHCGQFVGQVANLPLRRQIDNLPHVIALALIWLLTCAAAQAQCPIQLRNVSKQTGITFRHTDGSSGRRYLVETVSAGLATFDTKEFITIGVVVSATVVTDTTEATLPTLPMESVALLAIIWFP